MWIPDRRTLCCGGNRQIHTDYRNPVEEKGQRGHSQEESASSLALTGFYCFSGHITRRMILIYHAQVCFRQLQKTKERVLLIT